MYNEYNHVKYIHTYISMIYIICYIISVCTHTFLKYKLEVSYVTVQIFFGESN